MTTGEVTTYYFLGGRLVALRKGTSVEYVHQEHLSGTALSTDTAGAQKSAIKYLPFGETRSSTGTLGTDRKFTGQRLDGTGLYFCNARSYDPTIGRFISPDSLIQAPYSPQSLNRYSYVLNNPLLYTDPTGHCWGFARNLPGCGTVRATAREIWGLMTDAAKADQETAQWEAAGTDLLVTAVATTVTQAYSTGYAQEARAAQLNFDGATAVANLTEDAVVAGATQAAMTLSDPEVRELTTMPEEVQGYATILDWTGQFLEGAGSTLHFDPGAVERTVEQAAASAPLFGVESALVRRGAFWFTVTTIAGPPIGEITSDLLDNAARALQYSFEDMEEMWMLYQGSQ